MTSTTVQNWKPLADGLLLSLPLFINVDLITPGELAKTSPFVDRNEVLLVEIYEVYQPTALSALVMFQYVDNATGERRPELWTIEAKAREIAPDRRWAIKKPRRLWTAVPGSLKKCSPVK